MSYQSIIQKDLPLATWTLEETPTNNASIACDRFLGTTYNGTYHANQSSKELPIIYGSSRSIVIENNGTSSSALKIPSIDRFSIASYNEASSLEFWIKFVTSDGTIPTTSMTKIVGKPNSVTGVYLDKSSFVAVIGDTWASSTRVAIPVDNLRKTFHIAMSYTKDSISISANGQKAVASINENPFTSSYNSSNEYFYFYAITGHKYAIDTISLYAKSLSIPEIRRHMVYGLGYQIPDMIANNYSGTRYNMAMLRTPVNKKIEKADVAGWSKFKSITNLNIDGGTLRVPVFKTPTASDISYDTDSGYSFARTTSNPIVLSNLSAISQNANHGFGFILYKESGDTHSSDACIVEITNKNNTNKSIKFILVQNGSGEDIKVQLNGGQLQTLLSSASKITGRFSVGYYHDVANQNTINVFADTPTNSSTATIVTESGFTFYPNNANILSSSAGSKFNGGVVSVHNLTSLPSNASAHSLYDEIAAEINNYSAYANYSEQRFVIKCTSRYVFSIDLKTLCSNKGIVGFNRVEWGNDSDEVSVTIDGNGSSTEGEDAWLSLTSVSNRSQISDIFSETAGKTKFITFYIDILCNDVVLNPTKIFYFRLITYPTTLSTGVYSTPIIFNGPNIILKDTAAKGTSILPDRRDTPFLYDEEMGGLYVRHQATIDYDFAAVDEVDTLSGMKSISLLVNPKSTSTSIISLTDGTYTSSISYNGTAFSASGGTLYVNNSSSTLTATAGRWHHLVLVFSNRMLIDDSTSRKISITIGNGSDGIYVDEIITIDKTITATDVETINSLYKGTYSQKVGNSITSPSRISIIDTEIDATATDGTYFILQPVNSETTVLEPVDFIATSLPATYNSSNNLYIDSKQISNGDRILVKESGIYVVTIPAIGSSFTWTPTNYTSSIVYVKDGKKHKNEYWYRGVSGDWKQTSGIKKVNSYSKVGTKLVDQPVQE